MFKSKLPLCLLVLALRASAASPPPAAFDGAYTVLENAGFRDGMVLPDGGALGALIDWATYRPGQPFDYVLGKWDYRGQLVWSLQTLPNINRLAVSDDGHVFVARFSPDGEAAWVRVGIGAYEHVTSTRLALDGSGNVYFGSSPWDSPYVFDDVSVPGKGPFIVKFNPSGKALWALHPSSELSTEVFAVDPVGNVFMAYSTSQVLRLDKYAPDRTLLWRKEIRKYDWSGSAPQIHSLAVDAEGHCLVGGTFPRGTLSLGDTSLSTLAVSEVFLAKYSPDGDLRSALNYFPLLESWGREGASGIGNRV